MNDSNRKRRDSKAENLRPRAQKQEGGYRRKLLEISGVERATLLASIVEGNYLSIRDGMPVWLALSDTVVEQTCRVKPAPR